jgi:O-antigen ligase
MPEQTYQRFTETGTDTDTSGTDRIELWSAGLRMGAEYPLSGVGLGNFVWVNTRIYGYRAGVVQHNVFIQALSETGVPGLLLFVAMLIGIFLANRQARRDLPANHEWTPWLRTVSYGLDAGAIGFASTAFFITVLYFPFFWIQLALSVSLARIAANLRDASVRVANPS